MAESNQYTVTARKWRPLTFDDVVGQDHITRTLKNSIKTGRVHHGALFTGSRGVGKTTTARIFARALNCPNAADKGYEPCNECESCQSILNGSSLNVLEIDGASNNSVDDIRNLRESAKYAPANKGYKVYIIDEVHMLSTAAFNALLKLLEEPPEHLLFIFATTEPHKIPATIISRTQRYDFRRMEIAEIVSQLTMIAENEGIEISERALMTIAKKGDGSMRDSQSIFDQVIAFCGKQVDFEEMKQSLYLLDDTLFFEIEGYIRDRDIKGIFQSVKGVLDKGYDVEDMLSGITEHYRNLYTVSITGDTSMIVSDTQTLEEYSKRAKEYNSDYLLSVLGRLIKMELELKNSSIPQHRLELGLAALANIPRQFDISSILSGLPATNESEEEKKKPNLEERNTPDKLTPEPQTHQAKASYKKPVPTVRPTHKDDSSTENEQFSEEPSQDDLSSEENNGTASVTEGISDGENTEVANDSGDMTDSERELARFDEYMKRTFNARREQ